MGGVVNNKTGNNQSSDGKMKVFFVVGDMEGWGAQRVVVNLISNINRAKFLPILVLSKKKGECLAELPDDIKIYDLGRKGLRDFPKLIFRLAMILMKERPRIVYSVLFHSNILSILAKSIAPVSARIIICEQISNVIYDHVNQRSLYKWLMKKLYPKADLLIAASEGVKRDLIENIGIHPDRIKVIYNPLDIEKIRMLANEGKGDVTDNGPPLITNIGRLDIQKGHIYLLKAFSIVKRKMAAKLMIIGGGEKMDELRTLSKELGIEKDVIFAGYQRNPFKFVARSALYVNSSIFEGFGYTVVEAIALGLPVIATSCPHGPAEIIEDRKSGILIPPADVTTMAEAMIRVLEDENLRAKLSVEGAKRAEDFSIGRIVGEYERTFMEAV
jgi:glycosyltransferase involved in cell wall biosynthesis